MIMKKVRITAVRKVCHEDLMREFENPMEHACGVEEGQSWVSEDGRRHGGGCRAGRNGRQGAG